MVKFVGGYNFGSFRINKPDFLGVNVGIVDLSPRKKAELYDVISLKEGTAVYLKVCTFHNCMPVIKCTNFKTIKLSLLCFLGGGPNSLPPPPRSREKLKMP